MSENNSGKYIESLTCKNLRNNGLLTVDRLKVTTSASLPTTTGNFTVGANLHVNNDAQIDGDLTVDGVLTVMQQASNLRTLEVLGRTYLGSLGESSDVTIRRGATVGEALTVTGIATVGSLSTAGTVTIGGLIIPGATPGNLLQCTSGGLFVERSLAAVVAPVTGLGSIRMGVGADTTGAYAISMGATTSADANGISIGASGNPSSAGSGSICLNASTAGLTASTPGMFAVQTSSGYLTTQFINNGGFTENVWDGSWLITLGGLEYAIPLKNA